MFELARPIMAALALAVFWIHVLLIAAAAGQDLRDLVRLRRLLRPLTSPREGVVGLMRATVVRGDGPANTLARNVVEQVGRGKGDGTLYFSDAAHRSEIHGGALELGDGARVELGAVASDAALVWPDLATRAKVAAPSSSEQVTRAEPEARRAKGFQRAVQVELTTGQQVWIAGSWSSLPAVNQSTKASASGREALARAENTHAGSWRIEPGVAGQLLLSAIDPRRWLARKCWLIVAFILGAIAVAAACTVAALWPPLFDWVSMLGAGAALGFFLGVQPVGVSLNERVRTPDRAYLRGTWST
ncbi:hypothetical protein DB30_03308 [Enhygromyxa salina]|uniref:Uncharacterized protein n=1 Tax=Enhygromyxa salina TaxID=215803 RepID=A0A0C1ZIM5_9BACT|nr:hypothetical protein [Enhygromyxa salina]KIG17389.1 hypothetical protein DB30_03308 [Enhygromyxa salina]